MKLPQLTLRELFLLVVIAAMGCGWWVDHSRFRREFYNLQKITLEISKYAHDEYGMEGGFNEYSGYLYINGKRIWAVDPERFPEFSDSNGAHQPEP